MTDVPRIGPEPLTPTDMELIRLALNDLAFNNPFIRLPDGYEITDVAAEVEAIWRRLKALNPTK
jgi:hypothetical protein